MPKVRYSHVEGCFIAEDCGSKVEHRIDHCEIAHRSNTFPDLLAELEDVIEQLDGLGVVDWAGAEGLSLNAARTAIAKARG